MNKRFKKEGRYYRRYLFRVEDIANGVDIMAEPGKSWERRLAGEPDELTIDFVESLSIDQRLYKYDIAGSIAHAKMLAPSTRPRG